MSFLTEHAKNHPIVAGVSAQEPEPKGFFDTILSNIAGGAEGVIGGGLDYIGAQLNRLDEAGRASSYVDSIKDAKKGTLGKLGDSFINNGEYLNDKAAKNFAESGTLDKYQDMGILERLTSPEYLTNSRGLLADFSQMAGSAIPFAAASAVMPFGGAGAAAARGLGSMAARAGAKRIGSAIASKAGQQAGASAAKWGLGTGPLEAATNAGGMYADLKEQGLSDDEIARRMNSMIQEELPMDVVTQGIMGPILEGKGFKPIFNKGGRLGRAAGYSVNIPGSAGSEYMQEMTQQQAQNKWSGKEYGTFFHPTEDEQQAGRAAFMGALPLGVFGAGHTAYNNYKARLNRRNEEAAKSNPANPFAGMDDTVGDRTEIADVPASTVTVQNKDSGNSNDKEAFFRAIETQESGGNPDAVSSTGARGIYQIQPENWDAWAKEAGLAGASMDDDEAYRQVGRFKMGQYFDEYGPEGALVAWYSGPNNAQRWADGETTDQNGRPWDAPQGNGPSIADYVKSAMGHFADEQKQAPALEIPQAAEYTISGEVSNPNLTDLTEQKLRLLDRDYYNQFGRHFNITSMARNGGGESWHDSAQAFDAADDFLESNAEARSWLIDKAKEYGLYGLDEYSNPSANATGGHLHFSDHGEALQGSGSSSFTVPGVDMSRYNLTPEQEQENLEAAQALLANHEATPEQQQAVLDMAQQIMNTPVSEDIGEDAAHAVAMQEAIQNGDLQAIFRMHPQETANAIQNAGRPSPKKAPAVPQIESVKPQAATKPHIAQESVNRFAQTVDRITKLAAQGRIAEAALTARSSGMNNTMVNLLAQGVNASAGNVQNAIMNGIQLDVPTAFPALPAGRGITENTQSSQQAKQPESLSEAIAAIASSNPKAGAELANQNNMPTTASLIMGSAMNNQPLDNQAVNSAMNTDFENRRVQASRDRQALEERMRQAGLVRPNTAPDAGILVPNGAAAGTPNILVPDVRRPKSKTPTVNTNDAMAKLSDSPIFRQAKARGDIGAMASEADAMGFHKEAEQIRAKYGNAPARFDFAKRLSEVEKMSREERRALGRDHIEEMEAKNIPINDKLRRDLENGVPKAIVSAEKKIAKAEPEEAEQEASQQEPLEPAEEKAEPAEPVNAGNKKAAKDGGYELADGYRTESGKPLAEADAREFILKPDGGKDFGEISQDISEAVKEQSGAELKPGKIRLRVGNETQGLIHAKKHEQQAKDDGYASIEDMIADVASGFDEIYLRTPKKEGDQPTYSLVKHGNKSVGKMNGTAPVYFDLQNDGKGQYYIVITAIPTGDKSLKRQTKKDRLIYSSPGLDTAAASNSSAVSRSVSNDVGAEQNVLPASDKSNGSSVSSVAQEEKSDNSTEKKIIGKTGKTATVVTDSGREVNVTYRLVPAGRLITSHDEAGFTNEAYPQELQPRDRSRLSMRDQIHNMARNLRPADLAEGRNLNQGAPVIRADGVVLNGNGRTIAIKLAQKEGSESAKNYKKYLAEHAEEFGFKKSEVALLKNPALVRMAEDVDAETMKDIIGSTAGGSRMGASEQAESDAKKITLQDLERYVPNDTGDLTTYANRDFLQGLLGKLVSKNDRNAYLDKDGNINADGIQRMKRALFQAAYGDDELIAKMAESTDDSVRNMTNALTNSAPTVAHLNAKMDKGLAFPYDLANTIAEAVKRLDSLRRDGKKVSEYLNEQSMFREYEDTPEMRTVLQTLDENKRSAKKISAFINRMAELAEAQGNPKEKSLFGEVKPYSLHDIIQKAEKEAKDGLESDLFQETESVQPAEPSATERSDNDRLKKSETKHFESADYQHSKTGELIPSAKLKGNVDKETYQKISALAKTHGGYYSRFAKRFFFKDTGADGRNAFVKEAEQGVFGGENVKSVVYQKELNDTYTYDDAKKESKDIKDAFKQKRKEAYHAYKEGLITYEEARDQYIQLKKEIEDTDFPLYASKIRMLQDMDWALEQLEEKHRKRQQQAEPAKKETNAEPQTENKANTVKALYSDKSGSMKGGVADGVMTIWQKPGGIPKKEMSFTVALDELDKALKTGGANSSYTIHELAQKKLRAAIEAWIEGAETKAMRDKRRDLWENDTETGKLSAAQSRAEDSATNVIKNLYEQATGHKPQSTFEKAGEKNISKDVVPKREEPRKDSIFGSKEDAYADLLAELGINPDEADTILTAPEGIENTAEERERLEKELMAELNKISANPVFNPKIYTLGLKLAMTYVKDGISAAKKLIAKLEAMFGDKITPWAPAIVETINTWPKGVPFNEQQVMKFSKAVGACYESGMTSLDEIQEDMAELLKDQHKTFAPVIEASYNGVRKFFEMKEAQNHVTNSTDGLAARTGERPDRNAVGKDDAGRVPAGRDGQSISSAGTEVRPHSDLRLSDRGAAAGGKAGNRGVQAGKSDDSAGRSGSAGLSRSVRDSLEGDGTAAAQQPADRSGYRAAANGRDDAAAEQVNTPKPKAGSLEAKVDKALPMLLPEQRQDVVKAERQMLEKGSNGFLFTNGTGTGKTYVGMGLVKRMADSGKKNIMVVVPGDTIGRQWAEAAKKDFGIDAHFLENTKDKGQGVTVTTYANFGKNQALIQRDWDMVIADESQNLMSGKEGNVTNALKNLRTLTYHVTNLSDRYDRLHADELQKVHDDASLLDAYRSAKEKQLAEWKAMQPKDKPRVVFLSATPFPYVKDVDYAEGYLFDYDRSKDNNGGYNQPKAYSDFFIKHFGYRMRNGKLTQPDGKVDNRVMETQFHNWLRDKGVLSGRSIKVDKDYDRGWLLTPSAIGKSIDHGFEVLHNDKYAELEAFLRNAFDKRKKNYLLEYIKAREAVPVIKQYLQQGKKIVVFHQSVKEQDVVNPFDVEKMSLDTLEKKNPGLVAEIRRQYRAFQKECPELFDGSLEKLKSPVETLQAAFGDKLSLFNGKIPKKQRNANKNDFNDDNGRARVLVVQQDAGNAGISLHDTSGKFPRVLINLSVPTRPTYAMQIEGRIYRVGVQSNATFRYLTTGTNMEKHLFASEVGARASTAENLAMGDEARNLVESFRDGYMETMDGSWKRRLPGHAEEGTGGKAADYARESALSEMERAKAFYYARQKKTSRSKSAEGNDYFATPEPVGLKMVEWARAKDGDYMLEPSAGHGAISRWFSPNTQNIIIEPSGNLAPEAQMITPDAKLIENTFENHNIVNKYDGIVMNPPFGHGGKTAIAHVAKAYRHLWDGGRLVALIPEGPSADRYLNIWLNGATDAEGKVLRKPERGAVVLADVKLPAVTFERAGTRVGTHILVIDKYAADEEQARAHYGAQRQYDLRGVKDINELFDRLEPIEMPERYANVKEGEKKYSVSANNSVDNSDNMSHNVLSDRQKATIYNQIAPRIDSHIKEQIQSGKNAEEVLKELVSENSRHRAKLIGNYRASYRDLLNHVNDEPYKLQLVKQRTHNDNISQSVANATYDKMLSCLKEAVDYAGVIYREVALDRRGNHGHGDRLHDWVSAERDRVHDWVSAERQRAERESRNRNSKITGSRSTKDGFSNARKLSASEARAQKAQAMEKLRHDIAEALPNAKNIRDEGSSIFFTMPNRAEVEIHIADELTVRGAEADKARQAHGIGRGVTIKVNGTERTMGSKAVIQLSKTGDDGSVHHEVFHAVWDMVLTPKEKGAIIRAYQEEATRAGKDVIEVAADKYRDWFLAKEKGQAKTADGKPFKFGLLWRKIRAAVEKLRSVIAGSEEVNRIFRDIESGRVWERSLDNSQAENDNIANKVFDRYLNDGIMKMVEDTVAKEIGEHVNLADMSDAVARDEARDSLPYIRQMLVYFNDNRVRNNPNFANRLAVKIEYARRCFDNDERIRNEAVRQMDRDARQSRVSGTEQEAVSGGNSGGNVRPVRQGARGVSRSVSGGKYGARAHFEKLFEEESRSSKDGFSSAPKFAARSLDNSNNKGNNETKEKQFIDSYLAEKLTDAERQTVADKVKAGIDNRLEAMKQGDVAEERDNIPFFKRLRTTYHNAGKLKTLSEDIDGLRDKAALLYGYGRRCFDNDTRIEELINEQNVSGRQQRGIYRGGETAVAGNSNRNIAGNGRRSILGRGIVNNAGSNDVMEHFQKIIDSAYNSRNTESRSSKDGFSNARKFSIREMQTETEPAGAPNRIKKAMQELGKIATEDNVEVREKKASKIDNLNMLDMWAKSVRQVSRKNNAVKYFYNLARKAYDEQENLRSHFGEAMKRFNNYTKDEKDLADVSDVLLQGDMEGREYKAKELKDMGLSDNAIRAYKLVRLRLGMAYKLVNDARMQVTERSKIIPRTQLAEFKKAHFLTDDKILSILNKGDGKILVTYRGAKVYEHKDELLSAEAFKNLRRDKDACILHFSPEVDDLGDVSYRVDYTERIKPVTKLTGYVPHFFHKFMVYRKPTDENGNALLDENGDEVLIALGSGRSLKEAADLANRIAKEHPEQDFVIRAHGAESYENYNNVVVGDRDFNKMVKKIHKETDMSLDDARKFLKEKANVRRTGRHRFFGNLQKRKGAQGFETDVPWVLEHYFNAASRYTAMEKWKPQAISTYERWFGDFNAEPKTDIARYIKNHINDMNGVPSRFEKLLNKTLEKTALGRRISDYYNGRPALALSGSISAFNAVTKLGLGNFASAVTNFMQFINIGTRLNSYAWAMKGLQKALHPTKLDKRILKASGVLNDISLADNNGGYSRSRDSGRVRDTLGKIKRAADMTMLPFTAADTLMRKAAVLGAYYQGVAEQGMRPEKGKSISKMALQYAKDVNFDANFDYSTVSTPGAIRAGSVLTQQMFQFQKYPIMQFEFMWNHVVHAKDNAQRARFLVPYLLLAGAAGALPFGDLLNDFLSFVVGTFTGKDENLAEDMKAEMMKWAGSDPASKKLVESVIYGLPALAGIDISGRVGMSGAFSGKYYGAAPTSSAGAIANALGGPALGSAFNAIDQIHNNNPAEALKAISPALGNMAQAWVTGASYGKHHRVNTVYEDTYAKFIHGLGFRSTDESNTSFINSYLYNMRSRTADERKDAMDAYRREKTAENKRRMQDLGITDKQFQKYESDAKKSSQERALTENTKRKKKTPETEAEQDTKALKDFMR